ncbi:MULTISPECIES: hydantoinase B/oxoprolinase family protein [Arthrobacter]|uniref:5-oxoprolinase n=1 Tax=Arthrobacter psychrochitiniphilus TaxID=291045 RepID=A0A2V3DNQ6_9MICC|nr:hydantoinase B/oxoprolinase family protein [Arthrobacter psychrochitiniphilus]NYG17901.1 N-methylhydantoinase B [Arthrobacter psychrochitiniphilus]PXA64109.1 5-oxoprolinase [Arthrobacter psychrochitiniphilus]
MATLIETATQPLNAVDVDIVTLDLIENALRSARYEMDETLFRTALSPGIREQHDEFPLIADPAGKMIVGQFGLSIPDFLENFKGTIEEGDVLMTSDPYSCGAAISHANDWLVVMPIFYEGRIVGWASQFGHMTDVGGKTPASMPTDARTIFEEGVIIPPFKLYKKGERDETSLGIILNQVRKPDWNRADLNGIVAACRTASRRVQEMCARFGVDSYTSALNALLDRNYRAMKVLLALVFKEGETLSFTDYIDDDGRGYGPYELTMAITRTGDKVLIDLTGSSPQAQGPINYYINENLIRMFFGIYMITVADPQILWNDGFYPLVDVEIPDNSFWKPQYPAALNGRNHGIGRLFDLFGGLLGQANPDLLNAAGFSSSPHFMYSGNYSGGERKGEWFQLYSIGFGGIPGRPMGDGPDGHSLWPSFVNIPCEYLESYYPLVVDCWETIADSGGAGLHRGGNGVDVAYRFLEPGTIAIHDDRWLTYPWGVKGGEPGDRGKKWIDRADGTKEILPSKVHDVSVGKNDVLHFVTWGGGGWGDPLERDPELVCKEVRRGLVTADGARRNGVVCSEEGELDSVATQELRTQLRSTRSEPLPLFNRGGDMESLLANCLAETGLPAPIPPLAV